MQSIQITRFLLFSFLMTSFHGQTGMIDLIYRNGFELSEIQCPLAQPMTDMGGFYQGSGTLDPQDTIHFYNFPTENNQWLYLSSASGVLADTYFTLYSSDGSEVLAENNNNELDYSSDSLLIYRNLEETTLCLQVQDATALNTNQIQGGDYDYIAQVNVLDLNNTTGFNPDIEPNDSTATAQTGLSTFVYDGIDQEAALILTDYLDSNDVDTYQITTPNNALGAEVQVLQNRTITNGGTAANGGTARALELKIIESDGSVVYASVKPSNNVNKIIIPVQPSTDYYIQLARPQPPIGSNPFNVISWKTFSQQNQQELAVNNNSWDLAETPSAISIGNNSSYFIGGTLDGSTDIDWWRFDANAGDSINLFCSSWHVGSGVRNFNASIYDNPTGSAIQMGGESQLIGLAWYDSPAATAPSIVVSNTGFHYLRIFADLFDGDVSGRFYQCGIHVITP